MQQEFIELASQIVKQAKERFKLFEGLKLRQLETLTDMGNQLEALRKAWEQMTGEAVELPKFNQIMKID